MSNAHKRMSESMDGQGAQQIVGTIKSFNPSDHTVKCEIWGGMDDAYTTDWLPLGALATFGGGGGVVAPPVLGEQVLLVPEANSHGNYHITHRAFSVDHPPPISPATGKPVQSGEAAVFVPVTPGQPGIGAFWHLVGGKIMTAGIWTHTGTIHATDTITSDADVLADGVSLKNHGNTGVKAGSDTSGPPAQ